MSVSWLKRSGIQRGEGVANDEWHDTVSSVPAPEVEVTNDKATPVVGDERGIPSVNRSGFRSRALPFSIARSGPGRDRRRLAGAKPEDSGAARQGRPAGDQE